MLTKEQMDAKGFARTLIENGVLFLSNPENVAKFEEWKRSREEGKK